MKLRRTQLHALVWKKPVTQLAKEFGLSDVGLAKICHRYGIPLPERGYWARVDAGQKVSKKALPRKDYDPEIEIVDRAPITEAVLQAKKQKKEKQAEALANIGTVSVPKELHLPHKLTLMTLKFFEDIDKKLERQSRMKNPYDLRWEDRAPSADNGRYWCSPSHGFNLTVSRENLNRALCFLDTLVKTLEQQGFKIRNNVEGYRGKKAVEASKDDEGIRFQLNEGYKQRLLSADEIEETRAKLGYASQWERAPSGIFTFAMAGRNDWSDKKFVDGSRRIEERLPAIIAEFNDLVPRQKQARIEKAKAAEEAREKERIRALALHKRREQQRIFDEATEETARLESLERLEAYLQRLEERHKAEFGEISSNVADWLYVVRSIAQSHNPLENRLQYFRELRDHDPNKIDWMPESPKPSKDS